MGPFHILLDKMGLDQSGKTPLAVWWSWTGTWELDDNPARQDQPPKLFITQ